MRSRYYRAYRGGLWAVAAALIAAASAGPAERPAPTTSSAPTTSPVPTTSPAATAPAADTPSKALLQHWRYYKTTWAGTSIRNQSLADQQLVKGIVAAPPAEAAALRALMIAEYRRLTGLAKPDAFHCGHLAARIALTWLRVDKSKKLSAAQVVLNEKGMCEGVVAWGLRALEHLAGDIPAKHLTRYKDHLPATARDMMRLMKSRLPWSDQLGAQRRKLLDLRTRLEKLAPADKLTEDRTMQQFDAFYQAILPMDKLDSDKQAIRRLVVAFRTAYNERDDKAFAALWPKDHPAVRPLKTRPLSRKIEETHWQIVRWVPVYVMFKGDGARAFVVSQYRTKDGMLHPVTLQGFPAKRAKDGQWKLN